MNKFLAFIACVTLTITGFLVGMFVERSRWGVGNGTLPTNAIIGNILVSSPSGWVVRSGIDRIIARTENGDSEISFGPSLPERDATKEFSKILKGKRLILDPVVNGVELAYSTARSKRGELRIEGFVLCRGRYTYFHGNYPENRVKIEGMYSLLKGIREIL